jgi:hypothetical protein
MAEYKEMKSLNKVEDVTVFWSNTEFRRYAIRFNLRGVDEGWVYQNQKPTITELRAMLKARRGY